MLTIGRLEIAPMDLAFQPPRTGVAWTRIARGLRREVPVVGPILALFLICTLVLSTRGIAYDVPSVILNAELYLFSLGVLVICGLIAAFLRERPASPLDFVRTRFLANPRFVERIVLGLPLLATQIAFLPFFSTIKSAIPTFHPYNWDRTFIAIDKALFFGVDPWRIVQPVLGYPIVTAVLAVSYALWLALNYLGCGYIMFARINDVVRRQFFLTFALSWAIIGGLMATLLASYGPAFLGPMTGNSHYIELMSYLRGANMDVPIMSLNVQNMLLTQFRDSDTGLGSGISAMPSMHVTVCMVFYLASRALSKRASRWFLAYLVVIWVSSVHLAYHYAIDGLVSVLAVVLLWNLSGRFIGWWDRQIDSDRVQPTLRTNTVPAE